MARIVKKTSDTFVHKAVYRFLAIVFALILGGIFILAMGHNPLIVYYKMIDGSLGSLYRITAVLNKAIPLTIIALGISIAFKMHFWNIGGEGQVIMGAFCAAYFALGFPSLPGPLLITIMLAAGFVGGGLWAFIPGWFKAKFGTNETLFTLMLNYIALQWVKFLANGPWKDPGMRGMNEIAKFGENALLPKLFGIHIGWIFALLAALLVHIFMKYSKRGYEIAVIGESENTARYAGMNVKRIIISSVFLSGALCGLVGAIQAGAISKTLSVGISGGMGYTGIVIAWLSGLSAPIIVIVSFLFSAMIQGGSFIETAVGIPQTMANMLQGLILFFVLGSEFFLNYKIIWKKEEGEGAL